MKKLEKTIEINFVRHVRTTGCLAWKLKVLGMRGVPDRIILCPGGRAYFIEFKRESEIPRALQNHIHRMLRQLGFPVYVFDNTEEAVAQHDLLTQRLSGSRD